MHPMEERLDPSAAERARLGLVVHTLAQLGRSDQNLAEVAHDARNMVTALGLYCNLLQEPGVLSDSFRHYASELQLVTAASRRLVDKLSTLDAKLGSAAGQKTALSEDGSLVASSERARTTRSYESVAPPKLIENLAEQLTGMENLLSALVGPGIRLKIAAENGALPVHLSGEDLTRILVNLVKNAAEAMPDGGWIRIGLRETADAAAGVPGLLMTIEDSGPGLPKNILERLSLPSSVAPSESASRMTPLGRRGMGLPITRALVEAAGGRMRAANCAPAGACLMIELPVRSF
jgi:signal transduction histidine kinase